MGLRKFQKNSSNIHLKKWNYFLVLRLSDTDAWKLFKILKLALIIFLPLVCV